MTLGIIDRNIRVFVRVRPLVERELAERRREVIHADEATRSIITQEVGLQEALAFNNFDHVLSPHSGDQAILGEACVKLALDSLREGYNSSILTYGQTGSGKTFTVEQLTNELSRSLFQGISDRTQQGKIDCTVSATYIELYNEELRDLLLPPCPSQAAEFILFTSHQAPPLTSSIAIREHPNGEIFLEGASEIVVESEEELLLLVGVGNQARATAATALNSRSSRSHSVLIISLTQQLPPDPNTGELIIITGKLSIVDLAGSERTKKLKSEGTRMKEAVNINAGLSALGNVISALSENKKGQHISYRDSKLTRLLQDSIGGNSVTTLIACVSPAEDSLDESLNTLKYAARAKNIKTQPRQNASSSGMSDEQRAFTLLKQIIENVPVSKGLSMTLRELLEASKWSHESCLAGLQRLKQVLKCEPHQNVDAGMEALSSEVVRLTEEVARLRADKDGLEARSRIIQQAVSNGLHIISQLVADGKMSLESQDAVVSAIGGTSISASAYLLPAHSSPGVSRTRISSFPLNFSTGSKFKGEDGGAASNVGGLWKESDEAIALRGRVEELACLNQGLEAELATCTSELRQAREDLDKDELIFAGKMAEMAEMQKLIETMRGSVLPMDEKEVDQSWLVTYRHRYTDGSQSVGIPEGDGEVDDTVLYGERTDGDDAGGNENATAEAAGRLVGALEEEAWANKNQIVLEQEATREKEDHERERVAMQESIRALEAEIRDRENLIERLQFAESQARSASDFYKKQLQEAQQELDLKVAEVEGLQGELHSLLSDKVRTTEEKDALVSQCEERIVEANARLSALRKKLKDQEVLIRASMETEGLGPAATRVERLRAELARVKAQQDGLKKELVSKAAENEKKAQARARELSALKKAAEEAKRQVRKLEEETRALREVIRRKEAQLDVDRRRIKDLTSKPVSSSLSKGHTTFLGSIQKDQPGVPRGLGLPPKPPSACGASPSAVAATAKTSAFNTSARARALSYASTGKRDQTGGLTRARNLLPHPMSLPKQPIGKERSGSSNGLAMIESLLQSARDRKRAEIEMDEANHSLEALMTQSLRVDEQALHLSNRMKGGNAIDEREVQLLDRLERLARQLRDKINEFESMAESKRQERSKALQVETDIRRRLQEKPLNQHEATDALLRVVDAIGSSTARQRISFSTSTPTQSQAPLPSLQDPVPPIERSIPDSSNEQSVPCRQARPHISQPRPALISGRQLFD